MGRYFRRKGVGFGTERETRDWGRVGIGEAGRGRELKHYRR